MKFDDLVRITSDLQCFSTQFLMAGEDPRQIRLQLDRWSKAGKVVRIHKGLYTLAREYRKVPVEPAYIARNLYTPSYVSLQYALSWHHLIPEYVSVVTCITSGRPKEISTPLGSFRYHHIKQNYFRGFKSVPLASGDAALLALPEKALLDLIYLTPHSDSQEYIRELRLQNLDNIDIYRLREECSTFSGKKMAHACSIIESLIEGEREDD